MAGSWMRSDGSGTVPRSTSARVDDEEVIGLRRQVPLAAQRESTSPTVLDRGARSAPAHVVADGAGWVLDGLLEDRPVGGLQGPGHFVLDVRAARRPHVTEVIGSSR